MWNSLRTVPVLLSSAIDSVIVEAEVETVNPRRLRGAQLGLSFELVDTEGAVVQRVGNERIFSASSRRSLDIRGRIAPGLVGRRVTLRPNVRGLAGTSGPLVSNVVHVHTVLEVPLLGQQGPAAGKTTVSESPEPTVFALRPNFPNPFNPTTQINFDLPEAAAVSLVIYDVLGREVVTLVQGTREAGYHSVTWQATDVSSGVYFARFTATDAAGALRLSKVSKFVLTK